MLRGRVGGNATAGRLSLARKWALGGAARDGVARATYMCCRLASRGAMARAIRDSTHFRLDIFYDTNFSLFHRKTNGVGVGALDRSCIHPILSLLLPHTAKLRKLLILSSPLCVISLLFLI